MSASHELEADYREWQRLAEAEGDAIRAGNWIQACDCQNALKSLQPRIIEHTAQAQQEWADDRTAGTLSEANLRNIVSQLIELERRNYSLLDSRLHSARAEMNKLDVANHTLNRIQRSYAPSRPPGWTSFS